MRTTWEKLEGNWYQFSVEVDAEQFSQAVNQAYRKLVQKARIPGFRPGKAPRVIFERFYGKDSLIGEAVEAVVPVAYAQALEELAAEPIDQPEIDLEQAEDGQPLQFKGKVQVKPEVTLGPLSGFAIAPAEAGVDPEKVEEQLRRLQERQAQLVPDAEGEVREGSFAIIDFEGFLDGEPFAGGKGEDYTLQIGSNTFIPGFEEGLVGARAGETRDVKVTFPEDYHAEHLRGKETSFKVTVKDVKKKELPELDDALAQTVSAFQTVQELREDISNKLLANARAEADRNFRNRVLDSVAEAAQVDLPEVMVHRQIHHLMDDFAHTLSHQGMTLEAYVQATGTDSDAMHKEFAVPAARQVKRDLVLEAVAAKEGLAVAESEVDAEFDAMAQAYRNPGELETARHNPEYRKRVQDSLLKQKALAHLVALNRPQGSADPSPEPTPAVSE